MRSERRKPGEYQLAVCVLASGSKGNAIYFSDGRTTILVDAGLSGKEVERRLQSRNLSPEDLDAIIVSHEHTDHIQGVGVLARRFAVPLAGTGERFLKVGFEHAQPVGQSVGIFS